MDEHLPAPASEPKIEELLNQAVCQVVAAYEGLPASPAILGRMGAYAADIVRMQASLGMWREWSIADDRDLAELTCTFEVTQRGPLGVQSWVAPRWDFSRTKLRYLATVASPPPAQEG